jgi:ArsR family transcriptional regulator, arsenate/arsenite/antimonite-responsive transcriptional repressor / arsenate reductase (thioredoxin)
VEDDHQRRTSHHAINRSPKDLHRPLDRLCPLHPPRSTNHPSPACHHDRPTGDQQPRNCETRGVDQPQNLVSYHLRLLRGGGLVTSTRSSFDGRDSYYHLDLDRCADALTDSGATLHPALRRDAAPSILPMEPRWSRRLAVLFVCTGNSARSPIAEALLRHHSADHISVTSAGNRPKRHLHPNAVRVLREMFGIDVSTQRPQHLDTLADRRFSHVITLCDRTREACPEFPHPPPAAGPLEHPRPRHGR